MYQIFPERCNRLLRDQSQMQVSSVNVLNVCPYVKIPSDMTTELCRSIRKYQGYSQEDVCRSVKVLISVSFWWFCAQATHPISELTQYLIIFLYIKYKFDQNLPEWVMGSNLLLHKSSRFGTNCLWHLNVMVQIFWRQIQSP